MSVLLDGRQFIIDNSVKPFIHDRRIDLVAAQAAGAPVFPAAPEFLIFDARVDKQQVWLIKAIIPYAQQRINPALVTERLQFIPSSVGNTSFVFTPYISGGALGLFDFKYNPANTSATAANEPSVGGKGFTTISQEPMMDAHRALLSPVFTYAFVPPDTDFQVTFRLMPGGNLPAAFYIPPLAVPEPDPNIDRQRVDMAGCLIVGLQMSQQAYNQMVGELQEKGKRKVEGHKIMKDAWAWVQKKWGA